MPKKSAKQAVTGKAAAKKAVPKKAVPKKVAAKKAAAKRPVPKKVLAKTAGKGSAKTAPATAKTFALADLATRKARARRVGKMLDALYPDPAIPLYHTNPFTLCIAVLMSAHTTDKSVNAVTPELFRLAPTPEKMAELGQAEILRRIRTVGLAPTKSRNIWNLARIVMEQHGGKLPRTFEALEALPGVGHKTASVVMVQAFGHPAFPVDTHIHRLAERWGLSTGRNVEHTERDLKEVYPESEWGLRHLQFIYYGREKCPAQRHDSNACEICSELGA